MASLSNREDRASIISSEMLKPFVSDEAKMRMISDFRLSGSFISRRSICSILHWRFDAPDEDRPTNDDLRDEA